MRLKLPWRQETIMLPFPTPSTNKTIFVSVVNPVLSSDFDKKQ